MNFMLRFLFVMLACFGSFSLFAQKDFKLLHYHIDLKEVNIKEQKLKATTTISLAKNTPSAAKLMLYLEAMEVESIFFNDSIAMDFERKDSLLFIDFPSSLSTKQVGSLAINYHGTPAEDTQWGGFYFSNEDGGYAYNLGVGFAANPHSFGRAWFPCIDDFTERATFSFEVTTKANQRAVCNGQLTKRDSLPSGELKWHYELNQSIPAYLASVAVGHYEVLEMSYFSENQNKNIPIRLLAHERDTLNVRSSFAHLKDAMAAFEKCFGPYLFDLVGYVMVPFNSGAMEHATNIAYPKAKADGSVREERLMVHELAHHWWGNLVTCKSPEDMWLNEAFATYAEFLFQEEKYGKRAYQWAVADNQRFILQYAHLFDGDYLPITPVGHSHTYSTHVYRKGAAMLHNLRTYMGDEAFFKSMQAFLTENVFSPVGTMDFIRFFDRQTNQPIGVFFGDWFQTPGYPVFAYRSDSTVSKSEGQFVHYGHIEQKGLQRERLVSNLPMEVLFIGPDLQMKTIAVKVDGRHTALKIPLGFEPDHVVLNPNNAIVDGSNAWTLQETHKKTTYEAKNIDWELDFKKSIDSSDFFLHIAHFWHGFEDNEISIEGNNYQLSQDRFWQIHAVYPKKKLKGSFQVFFDAGTNRNAKIGGFMDNSLMLKEGNELTLLYKADAESEWEVYSGLKNIAVEGQTGVATLKYLKNGAYIWGVQK